MSQPLSQTEPDTAPAAQTASDPAPRATLHTTTSLCRDCKHAVPARVVDRDGEVWMEKQCPEHGAQEVRLSTDADWYRRNRAIEPRLVPPRATPVEVDQGCPFDCGACTAHQAAVRLPVVTITSACNLDCPICYVHNKNKDPYNMSREHMAAILDHLAAEHGGDIDIVNLTGGEPTLHPELLDFVQMARDAGVHRVSVCTNGIRLAKDEELVKRFAELGVRVALSFDSFEEDADYLLQGAHLLAIKQRVMDLLEEHQVDCTLIPVMTKGVNDHEVGQIIEYALGKRCVRHLEIHTMTYTGQSGASFDRSGRISMVEVLDQIAATTGGLLGRDDFVPSPCAHPLCYQIAYLLVDPDGGPDSPPIPLTRLIDRATLYESLSERLYLEPSPRLEAALSDAINRLWAEDDPDAAPALASLRKLLLDMFPPDRALTQDESLRVSERWFKAIYIHSHMDEETFDVERVVQCCDSNCYPDGTSVPVCSYNVLYRETEQHFMMKPAPRVKRRGGHLFPILS
ncbi:radical SAM protein [Haliangium sp.]|uniref:radical SAM protein n=1 Tax=Haliangium sp. TaxID=2663208 RepID=UPI003D13BB6B